MPRMPKFYKYYRHGNYRMQGTLKELESKLGKTPGELNTLVRRGESADLHKKLLQGRMPEHLEEIPIEEPEYVLYDGDDIESIGTMDEIAEETGLKRETIRWYGTPSGHARGDRVLVKMEEDEECS